MRLFPGVGGDGCDLIDRSASQDGRIGEASSWDVNPIRGVCAWNDRKARGSLPKKHPLLPNPSRLDDYLRFCAFACALCLPGISATGRVGSICSGCAWPAQSSAHSDDSVQHFDSKSEMFVLISQAGRLNQDWLCIVFYKTRTRGIRLESTLIYGVFTVRWTGPELYRKRRSRDRVRGKEGLRRIR